jgi:uncharacterized protein (DUF1330 family)
MTAYVIAHLKNVAPEEEDVLTYMQRVPATIEAFGGRYTVKGGPAEIREGTWPGVVAVIAFPDLAAARGWYDSPAYQEILPLRTRHIESDLIVIPGVPDDSDAA